MHNLEVQIWHWALHALRSSVNILFYYVLVRSVLVNFLSKRIERAWRKNHPVSERKVAIKEHYHLHALQKGHLAPNVVVCEEGKCALI